MRSISLLSILVVCSVTVSAQDTAATKLLKQRSKSLQPAITRVSPSVYCATGYSPANISMIVGDTGVVIVDTGMFPAHAETVLKEFRKISDLPIRAVILTHGHGDHTGGTTVFKSANGTGLEPPVYARTPFNTEGAHFDSAAVTINGQRGARQGGFRLPPEKRINNGIALAEYPPEGQNVFAGASVQPDITVEEGRNAINVASIKLELVAAPGETSDQLYVWFPAEEVVFTGDNFYRSWPNLYAIRGTGYRNVLAWISSLDRMIAEGPEHVVPGHTLPVLGRDETTEILSTYRDAIQYVFEATVEGMNKGLTPDELVHTIRLPDEWADKDYLREFYGNIQWSIRAIYSGYLGWFDGNPTNLLPMAPADEARKMAELAGGPDQLAARAREALDRGDAQWCAELCDHLIAINHDLNASRLLKASALEAIAENVVSGIGRNYYLTVAQELRQKAASSSE